MSWSNVGSNGYGPFLSADSTSDPLWLEDLSAGAVGSMDDELQPGSRWPPPGDPMSADTFADFLTANDPFPSSIVASDIVFSHPPSDLTTQPTSVSAVGVAGPEPVGPTKESLVASATDDPPSTTVGKKLKNRNCVGGPLNPRCTASCEAQNKESICAACRLVLVDTSNLKHQAKPDLRKPSSLCLLCRTKVVLPYKLRHKARFYPLKFKAVDANTEFGIDVVGLLVFSDDSVRHAVLGPSAIRSTQTRKELEREKELRQAIQAAVFSPQDQRRLLPADGIPFHYDRGSRAGFRPHVRLEWPVSEAKGLAAGSSVTVESKPPRCRCCLCNAHGTSAASVNVKHTVARSGRSRSKRKRLSASEKDNHTSSKHRKPTTTSLMAPNAWQEYPHGQIPSVFMTVVNVTLPKERSKVWFMFPARAGPSSSPRSPSPVDATKNAASRSSAGSDATMSPVLPMIQNASPTPSDSSASHAHPSFPSTGTDNQARPVSVDWVWNEPMQQYCFWPPRVPSDLLADRSVIQLDVPVYAAWPSHLESPSSQSGHCSSSSSSSSSASLSPPHQSGPDIDSQQCRRLFLGMFRYVLAEDKTEESLALTVKADNSPFHPSPLPSPDTTLGHAIVHRRVAFRMPWQNFGQSDWVNSLARGVRSVVEEYCATRSQSISSTSWIRQFLPWLTSSSVQEQRSSLVDAVEVNPLRRDVAQFLVDSWLRKTGTCAECSHPLCLFKQCMQGRLHRRLPFLYYVLAFNDGELLDYCLGFSNPSEHELSSLWTVARQLQAHRAAVASRTANEEKAWTSVQRVLLTYHAQVSSFCIDEIAGDLASVSLPEEPATASSPAEQADMLAEHGYEEHAPVRVVCHQVEMLASQGQWSFDCAGDQITALEFSNTLRNGSGSLLAAGDAAGRVKLLRFAAGTPDCGPQLDQVASFGAFTLPTRRPTGGVLGSTTLVALRWLLGTPRGARLLTANDKEVKLWRLPWRSLSTSASPNNVKLRRTYTGAHQWNIHSVSVNSDGETFLSADALSVKLWNVDRITGYELLDLSPNDNAQLSVSETLTTVNFHPTLCNLLVYGTSAGRILCSDLRTGSKHNSGNVDWISDFKDSTSSASSSSSGDAGGSSALATSSGRQSSAIAHAYFSVDGNHVIARDFSSLTIWDVKMTKQPLHSLDVHGVAGQRLTSSDRVFDRFAASTSSSQKYHASGSYNGSLVVASNDLSDYSAIQCGSDGQLGGSDAVVTKFGDSLAKDKDVLGVTAWGALEHGNGLDRDIDVASLEQEWRSWRSHGGSRPTTPTNVNAQSDELVLGNEGRVDQVCWHSSVDVMAASSSAKVYLYELQHPKAGQFYSGDDAVHVY